jgi:3-keto-disaccharide hydrolase
MRFASQLVAAAALVVFALLAAAESSSAQEPLPKATIDGTGPGWKELTLDDFQMVNGNDDTWTWKDNVIHCTGQPVGVTRSKEPVTNFELVAQWRHLKSGGNSGIFVWAAEEALKDLPKGKLPPGGIEVQVLDHGFKENYEKTSGKKADWFTTNGDVFPVGKSKMTPFPPTSPNGERSFPTKELSKGVGEWNHYYIRAINAEIRLWVNGEEVSGGTKCEPASGYLCLESEGAPVEFKNLRIRKLP